MFQTASVVGAVRRTIESTYTDLMTVSVMADIKDDVFDDKCEQIIVENEPCRISYKTDSTASRASSGDGAANIEQTVELFCRPELDIPAGCKISVVRSGVSCNYCRSGEPSRYDTHQEVSLALFKRWA